MRVIRIALVVLAAMSMTAAAKADSTMSPTMADAKIAIAKGNVAYLKALKDASAVEMARLFTPDGALMNSDGMVVIGPAEIEKFYSVGPANSITGTIHTVGIDLDGDTAYERGTYVFTISGKKPVTFSGTYFTIWREEPDGSWKIRVDAGFPAGKG